MVHRVEAFGAKEKFQAWLERGDSILVYQNQDLGHPDIGRLMFLPSKEAPALGSRGPDTNSCGLGWRYTLQSIETSLENFEFKCPTPDELYKDGCPSKLKVTLAKRLSHSGEFLVLAQNICASRDRFTAYGVRRANGECVAIHSWLSMECVAIHSWLSMKYMTDPNKEPVFNLERGEIWVSF